MYTAYVLTDETRTYLEAKFPPRYSKFVGHHVTIEFGVPRDTVPPTAAEEVKVLGRIDSGDGLEALVVSVNGSRERPDGKAFHITWSLEPEKYSPKDSNELLSNSLRYTMSVPHIINTVPSVLE